MEQFYTQYISQFNSTHVEQISLSKWLNYGLVCHCLTSFYLHGGSHIKQVRYQVW